MQTFEQILDDILLGLADDFESGNGKLRWFEASVDEFEPLRECLATLIAEGSLGSLGKSYQLTAKGYQKYKPRLDALRTFSR